MITAPPITVEVIQGDEPAGPAIQAWARMLLAMVAAEDRALEEAETSGQAPATETGKRKQKGATFNANGHPPSSR